MKMLQAALAPERASSETDDGWETLYEQHFDFVWRNLRRLGVGEASADDAAQDVFLVAHRRMADFEGRSSMRTWLYGILVRVAHDYRRARARADAKAAAVALTESEPSPSPADVVAKREAARLLEEVLDSLDTDKRAVFVLVELEQSTVADVAAALGINVNTAHARLRSARQRIRGRQVACQGEEVMDKAAQDLLERARGAHDPSAADRARVRRKLAVRIVAGSAALSGMAKASVLGSHAALKIVASLVLVAAVGAYAVHATRSVPPNAEPKQELALTAEAPMPARAAALATQAPQAAIDVPTATAPQPVVQRGAAQRPKPRPEPTPDLDAENALVSEAQGAIQRNDFSTALTKLDAYDRAFPAGILLEEARAARVVALCGAGRAVEAQALKRTFLATYPRSPLAPRVRASCPNP